MRSGQGRGDSRGRRGCHPSGQHSTFAVAIGKSAPRDQRQHSPEGGRGDDQSGAKQAETVSFLKFRDEEGDTTDEDRLCGLGGHSEGEHPPSAGGSDRSWCLDRCCRIHFQARLSRLGRFEVQSPAKQPGGIGSSAGRFPC